MRRLILIALAAAMFACGKSQPGDENTGEKRWFIAAANPLAVEAGADILSRGGSAVDAAIAVQAVLGLVEPQSSGFGGGAFMLHYDPRNDLLETFDGREVAPASATPERFMLPSGEPMPFYDAVAGGLSVGVPGVVAMLGAAHQEKGVLPWSDLLAPAERLAMDGFEISPRLHKFISQIPRLKQLPDAAAYFYTDEGAPLPAGHLLKNPDYAATLQMLRRSGPRAFYDGPIAEEIVEAVNTAPNPGGMTLDDLLNYQPVKRAPVCGPYRTFKVCSMGPPSSGGVTLLQMLSMLQAFDVKGASANSIEAVHLLFEAGRLAFADRNQYLADQDQAGAVSGLSQEEVIAGLLNADYLAERASMIDRTAAAAEVRAGDPSVYLGANSEKWRRLAPSVSPDPPSTSHFVIVDGEGRVASMTTTVEFPFGSHLMAGGMMLNNQLTDFSFIPVRDGAPVANAVAPGKRPRSSMTPVIMFDGDGDVYAAAGSPGGPAIIGYVAKTLIGIVDWNLSMQEAIDLPNAVYPRNQPLLEQNRFDPQIVAGLARLGHETVSRELDSGIHGFRVNADGSYDGGADSRREGVWKTGTIDAQQR